MGFQQENSLSGMDAVSAELDVYGHKMKWGPDNKEVGFQQENSLSGMDAVPQ